MEYLIKKGTDLFPDLKEAGCNLHNIGEKHDYFGIGETMQEKYDRLKDTIFDKYRYLFYSFDQSYFDKHLNIDKTNANTPSKSCKTKSDLFIHLTCSEGLILVSYINNINSNIKTEKKINIQELVEFKSRIELILNQTEQKLPEFTFLQTLINYEISKIKDSNSFRKIFFNSAQNLMILGILITSMINIPDTIKNAYSLTIFQIILQIINNGGYLYLKAYENYQEKNAFTLFKKRMEKTNYEGKLNQNSLYNIMTILNYSIGSIIDKIKKFTSEQNISVDKLCLNHLELCYSDECENQGININLLEKFKPGRNIDKFKDFESIIGEHLVSVEIFMKDVTNKIYDKIIGFFDITKLNDTFQFNQEVIKSIVDKNLIDMYNKKTKNILIDSSDNKFFDLITEDNKKFLHESINVLIYIILNIIKYFTKSIDGVTKDNLRMKIKNTIYINVIRSTIINVEFKDKTQLPSTKKIKDMINARLGKEIPSYLINHDKKTDGEFFKKYNIPFYNLVILYFILDHIQLKFPYYELYTFNNS